MDDRFPRVAISRPRVQGGLAAIATGLLASGLTLDLLFLVLGEGAFYDVAWYVHLAAAALIAAAVLPGAAAMIAEARRAPAARARNDDGQAVAIVLAGITVVWDLVLRAGHGAVTGAELGVAVAMAIASLGLMAYSSALGDWLAERFPAGRRVPGPTPAAEAEARRRSHETLRR